MSKIIKLLIIILSMLTQLASSPQIQNNYIDNSNTFNNEYLQKLYEEDRIIFGDDTYKEQEIEYLNTLGEDIPGKYLEMFYSEGWQFRFTNEMIDESGVEYPYGTLIGLTLLNKKEIQILNYPEDYVTRDTLYHEFAHYIDSKNDFISLEDEFKELYTTNVDIYEARRYAKTNEKEWFADLVVDYYFYNEKMDNFQDLENFIANILEEDL